MGRESVWQWERVARFGCGYGMSMPICRPPSSDSRRSCSVTSTPRATTRSPTWPKPRGCRWGLSPQLSRRLGLKGYQDLRLSLAREAVVVDAAETAGHRLDLPAGPPEVVRALERSFGRALESLVETAGRLDPAAVARAVSAIRDARRVECVGVGTASFLAQELALKLRKLGIDAIAHPDLHMQAMSAGLLGHGDVLVAISHSGRTIDTIRAAELARRRGGDDHRDPE